MDNLILCTDSSLSDYSFFDLSLAPSLLLYAYVPIAIISLIFGCILLLASKKEKFSLPNKLIFFLTLTFSIHLINELLQWIVVPVGYVYFSWSLSILLHAIIAFQILFFTVSFISQQKPTYTMNLLVAISILPIVLFLPTNLNLQNFNVDTCAAENGILWLYLYIIEAGTIITLLALTIKSFVTHFKDKSGSHKKNIYTLLASLSFTIIFFGSEIIGDITSAYEINLVGPIGMVLFMVTLTFLTIKYQAFSIKILGAQALIFFLVAILGSMFFFFESPLNRLLLSFNMLLALGAGLLLIKTVKNEIAQKEALQDATERLTNTNQRLRELDKLKSEFVSIASHQLRSPITAISGYASLIREGSYGEVPQKIADPLMRIEESARVMASSIEDYLNVSRIEAGNMKYEFTEFNITSLVEHICDDLRPEALRRGLLLTFRHHMDGKGFVRADFGKTSQVIHNLINNALKYTVKGTISVYVHDDESNNTVKIDIADTGMGMSPETVSTIFQKFERGKGASRINLNGTGLGLFIARKIAEAMGATITASSDGEGKGSRFTVTFKLLP